MKYAARARVCYEKGMYGVTEHTTLDIFAEVVHVLVFYI